PDDPMNPTHRSINCSHRAATAALVLVGALLTYSANAAEEMYRPKAEPGGLRIEPEITSLTTTGGITTVSWYGLRAYYTLQACPSFDGGGWADAGTVRAADYATNISMPALGDQGFFKLKTNNKFVGTGACADCHAEKFDSW